MLNVAEAAELLGEVSKRSWQYWEAGRSKVPVNVSLKMKNLMILRDQTISKIESDCLENKVEEIKWYKTYQEFKNDYPSKSEVIWKMHQSISSFIFSRKENISLNEKADKDNDINVFFYKYFYNLTDSNLDF